VPVVLVLVLALVVAAAAGGLPDFAAPTATGMKDLAMPRAPGALPPAAPSGGLSFEGASISEAPSEVPSLLGSKLAVTMPPACFVIIAL
jgi:hypothetical protein